MYDMAQPTCERTCVPGTAASLRSSLDAFGGARRQNCHCDAELLAGAKAQRAAGVVRAALKATFNEELCWRCDVHRIAAHTSSHGRGSHRSDAGFGCVVPAVQISAARFAYTAVPQISPRGAQLWCTRLCKQWSMLATALGRTGVENITFYLLLG